MSKEDDAEWASIKNPVSVGDDPLLRELLRNEPWK